MHLPSYILISLFASLAFAGLHNHLPCLKLRKGLFLTNFVHNFWITNSVWFGSLHSTATALLDAIIIIDNSLVFLDLAKRF